MTNLVSLLKLYMQWGIDTSIATSPTNKETKPKPAPTLSHTQAVSKEKGRPKKERVAMTQSPSEIAHLATTQAHAATDLQGLYKTIRTFTPCRLQQTAMNTVLPYGPSRAPLMIIGDAPDSEEDRTGDVRKGAIGTIFADLLTYLPWDPAKLIIAPAIAWRPPGGRPLDREEENIYRPFLEKTIALLEPQHLLLCGKLASHILLRKRIPLPQKNWLSYKPKEGMEIPTMAMRHPLQLKTSAKARQEIWNCLMNVAQKLENYL